MEMILMIEDPLVNPPPPSGNRLLKTVAIGGAFVAILAIGIAVGLWMRLQTVSEQVVQVVVTATPDPAAQTVAKTQNTGDSADIQSDSNTNSSVENEVASDSTEFASNDAAPTPTIMDFLLSDARHFQGSPDAPVTLIEFSDFK